MNGTVKTKSINSGFYGWQQVLAGFILTCFSMYLVGSAAGFYMPYAAPDLHVDIPTYSWLFTISPITTALAVMVIGPKMQTGNTRKIMLICAIICGVSHLCQGFVTQMWQMFILWGLCTLGAGGLTNYPVQLLVTTWFNDNRGVAQGFAYAGVGVGGIFLSPFINGMISNPQIGWRKAFVISGCIVLATSIPTILLLVKNRPSDYGQKPYQYPSDKAGGRKKANRGVDPGYAGITRNLAVKTPAFWASAVTLFFIGLVASGIMIHVATYLGFIGAAPGWISLVMSVYSGVAIAGKFASGRIFDKSGVLGGMLYCCVFVVAAVLFLLAAPKNISLALGYAVCMGLGLSLASLGPPLLVSQTFGTKEYGSIFSLLNTVFMAGNVIGPVLSSYIFKATKSYDMVWIVYSILGVMTFLSGALTYRLGKPLHEKYRTDNDAKAGV